MQKWEIMVRCGGGYGTEFLRFWDFFVLVFPGNPEIFDSFGFYWNFLPRIFEIITSDWNFYVRSEIPQKSNWFLR